MSHFCPEISLGIDLTYFTNDQVVVVLKAWVDNLMKPELNQFVLKIEKREKKRIFFLPRD